MTVHGVNSQPSTVNSQHHSGVTGNDITRRAQVKTNIEDRNLVYLSHNQAAKSGLNRSMLDADRGQFTTVIKYVAGKLGKSVVFLDPKGTSQHCWNCLNKVPKELSD
ncbi:hypothetical protein Q5692_20840 [Microcoleus sp. C2C3]|uniref:zinc ribbon domain-containing protein n=1 Tax=unclassified Microcoleus TaxID=2642155 RepID=UPI002FD26409